ncbi:MAG: hypothetical protein ABL959_22325 [Pyrinomonadaceae bacterium]
MDVGEVCSELREIPRGLAQINPVISGFNTDIECNGTVYHVQTEDKGAPALMIMSLVYDKGTILASKRAKYDDLDVNALDENEIADRLARQHKLMCAAVKAGRINELVDMTRKASAEAAAAKSVAAESVDAGESVSTPMPPPQSIEPGASFDPAQSLESAHPVEVAVPAGGLPGLSISAGDSDPTEVPGEISLDSISFDDLPVLDAEIIEDVEILPPDAVAVVSELSGKDRPVNQKLSLEIIGDSKFKGGERKSLTIMLTRGTERKVVGDAQILVKVLGSAFRPVIFHAKSDQNGLARIHLQLPQFRAGRAALLIRAMTDGEEIELRKIVTPG